jgi:hypothetical protein
VGGKRVGGELELEAVMGRFSGAEAGCRDGG